MPHCSRAIYRAEKAIYRAGNAPAGAAVSLRGSRRAFCAGGGGSQRKRPRRRPNKNRRMEGKIRAKHAVAAA